ncbi:MAG: hypothetical protein IT385_10275 [Deltaproteobacteria bacterium]|nr:hypothetical protein [Deltaproteobacteria bacterium]
MRLTLFAVVALAGCDLTPDVGGPTSDRCSNADSDPASEVRFGRDIQPILYRDAVGCVPCHDPDSGNAIGFTLGGLDLSDHSGVLAGGVRSGSSNVLPGRPCDSALYKKVSPGPPFGGRMPLNGPPFLSEEEIGLIHDWIAEGGQDN